MPIDSSPPWPSIEMPTGAGVAAQPRSRCEHSPSSAAPDTGHYWRCPPLTKWHTHLPNIVESVEAVLGRLLATTTTQAGGHYERNVDEDE